MKILRCLPKEWDPKVTAIMESKDLSTYSLDKFLGSLLAHEQTLLARDKEITPKKKEEKSKGIALQANSLQEESTSGGSDEEEIAMLSRRLDTLMKRRNQRYGSSSYANFRTNKSSAGESMIRCFHCNKFGHIKSDCLELLVEVKERRKRKEEPKENKKKYKKEYKKKKHHKKAMWAFSGSSSSSSSESEGEAKICLMAKGDESSDEECLHSRENEGI